MKRIFSTVLILTLLLTMLPAAGAATGYDRGYTGSMPGDGVIYAEGLDVSSWQGASLDFQNFADAGYDYVILRCGTTKGKDTCFETYYAKAKAAGLDVGAYYYSYATDVNGAYADAANMISWMGDKTFEYPIYFDYEDSSQGNIDGTNASKICLAFMDTLRDAGYLVGLYSMASWLDQSWVTTSGIRGKYEGWVARYLNNGGHSTWDPTYSVTYGMYQYTASKYVSGEGPFDANVCYKDYPTIVRTYGFNGYAPETGHTVNFNSNGGSYVDAVFVEDGGRLTAPTNPTRTGFNFVGWYCNPELTDPYDFSTPVPYSFTLYAKWEEAYWGVQTDLLPVQEELVLADYDGTGQYIWPYYNSDGSVTLYNGVKNDENYSWPRAYMVYENSIDSVNDGHIYVKYSSSAQFNAVIDYLDADGGYHSVRLSELAGNGTADFPAGDQEILVDFGAYIAAQGHLTASDGSAHSRNVKFTRMTYYVVGGLDSYVRLYEAKFTPTYTVSFVTNGGTEVSPVQVAPGMALPEPTAPSRFAFDFAGWYCNPELTDVYDFTTPVNYDFNLYAKWTEADWAPLDSMLPVKGELVYEDFQGTGESVWDYYNDDGSVTLYNAVAAVSYSWPSGAMYVEKQVDLKQTPYLHLNFRCDSAFNCEVTYLDDNGNERAVNLSTVAGLETTDFTAGIYDEYLDFAAYLETQGHTPASGKLKITKVTYYVVGGTDCYVRLYDVQFAAAPVVASLAGQGFSLSYEDEILVNFYFTAQNVTDAEIGMLVFYSEPENVDFAAADAVYTAVYDAVNHRYMAQTSGIAAKQMGDTRYYAAYAKLADGTMAYSPVYRYSPKQYAVNMLGKDSTGAAQKALCVAMLNYGAQAQIFFAYKTEDLMNAVLTQDQQSLVTAYDAGLFAGAVPADSTKVGGFAKTERGFSQLAATVSFESAFAINYYFTPNSFVSGNVSFYYWTSDAYGTADVLTAENASGMTTMTMNSDGSYWAQVTGIAAKHLDDTYYVAGLYTDGDGNTCCTGVVAYSLSKYCMNNAVDGKQMQDLAAATAMYGYYAKAYFG